MYISLSGRIVEGIDPRPSIEDFLSLASSAGFGGVGLRSWQLPDPFSAEAIAHLSRLATATGLKIASLTVNSEQARVWLPNAERLGANVVQCPIETRIPDDLAPSIRIGPQIHTGGAFETLASSKKQLDTLPPRYGVVVEPANLLLSGMTKWNETELMLIKSRIIGCNFQSLEVIPVGTEAVELSNGSVVPFRRVIPQDNDQLDFGTFFRVLQNAGYDGYINVIEPTPKNADLRHFVLSYAEYLRDQLDDIWN